MSCEGTELMDAYSVLLQKLLLQQLKRVQTDRREYEGEVHTLKMTNPESTIKTSLSASNQLVFGFRLFFGL